MTIGEALHEVTSILTTHNIEDSHIEARALLGFILDMSPAELYTYPEHTLDDDQIASLHTLLDRRIQHEPLAYITQEKEFYGLKFYIDKRVLIPRPETEFLVEKALEILNSEENLSATNNTLRVADIGTGSGIVAICIALNAPHVKIYATDISGDSLEVAIYNGERYNVTDRISFLKGSLLEPLEQPVDLLTANLPYVLSRELSLLCPEIKYYEPGIALDGGPEGLDKIGALIKGIRGKIRHNGHLLLEIGANQEHQIVSIVNQYLHNTSIDILQDYNGLPRIVQIGLHGYDE
jgi:release factor glutamine methyltransferase